MFKYVIFIFFIYQNATTRATESRYTRYDNFEDDTDARIKRKVARTHATFSREPIGIAGKKATILGEFRDFDFDSDAHFLKVEFIEEEKERGKGEGEGENVFFASNRVGIYVLSHIRNHITLISNRFVSAFQLNIARIASLAAIEFRRY